MGTEPDFGSALDRNNVLEVEIGNPAIHHANKNFEEIDHGRNGDDS